MELHNANTPAIAVIILNWNGEKLLREYLPKVVRSTDLSLSRIIIADNGSTDASLEYVTAEFSSQVEVLPFPENYGFAGGYNKAIALVGNYRYVVLLNSDVATTDGWDRELYNYMESHPEVAACQPKILSYRQPDTFEYAGAAGGYLDKFGYPYCRGRIFADCEKDEGQYDTVANVFWASGACLMVRRDVFLSAGGLDTRFFAHMEEIDLCWRIKLAGHSVSAIPMAVVYHLGGGSLPVENPRKTYLNFRNNLLMLYKNLPVNVRNSILLKRRLLDTLAWVKFVCIFDFKNAAAVFNAHRDFAKMRVSYNTLPSKNLLQADRESSCNILIEYYIKRCRKFSQL